MKILNNKISIYNPPFIIAEISGNHKGSLKRAFKIIKKAKEIGVSAVKLQTFDLDEMTINSKNKNFIINDKTSPWYKKNLYQLYKVAQTPKKWHQGIFKYCKKIGIICFSSVFDLKSLSIDLLFCVEYFTCLITVKIFFRYSSLVSGLSPLLGSK